MRIALAQMRMTKDMEENFLHALWHLEWAASAGAQLCLFPEIQLCPFFPREPGQNVSQYRMTLAHPYIRELQEKCRALHIMASPNFYISENGRAYDMSLLIDEQGEILGRQKMVHIAQQKEFYEQDYYSPSDEGFEVFETVHGRIGIVVCFDRHYPESIRTEALQGADLILIPTANTNGEPADLYRWEIQVQAFQNTVHLAMCNRVGREGDAVFSGQAMVADDRGNLIALAGAGEELLVADLDLQGTKERRQGAYMPLRRPELYL